MSLVLYCFLECALILYKNRRFSYEHLCTLSFFIGLLQCFINSGIINSEFRYFKLWDQKLQFKGFVSEILQELFLWDFVTLSNDFFTCEFQFIYSYFFSGTHKFYISESLNSQKQ